jgi:hypothetical protein
MKTPSNLESKGRDFQPRNPWRHLLRRPAVILLVACALVMAAIPSQAANIIWLSFHPADGTPSANATTAGFTNAPDAAYTQLLRNAGHTVTRIVSIEEAHTNAALVAQLNAADLVILSRSLPSGHFQSDAETAFWNGITTPVMVLGAYIERGGTGGGSRMGLMVGETIPDTDGPIRLMATDPTHPIFAGIALGTSNVMANTFATSGTNGTIAFTNRLQRGISVITGPTAGGGKVLATVSGDPNANGGLVIGEWQPGGILSTTNGTSPADVLGGRRLVFLTGTREQTITAEGAGIYDLTADGARMFLNAVNYLSPADASYPATVLSQSPLVYYRFNDLVSALPPVVATNSGALGVPGNGVYVNCPAHPQPGALAGSADTSASFDGQGQSVDVPFDASLNQSGPFTIEAWVRLTAFTNFNRTVIASRWVATGVQQGYQLRVRNAAGANNWQFTTFNGTGANDLNGGPNVPFNEWTHVVATHDGSLNRIYVNGVLVATSAAAVTYAPNSTAGVFRIGGGLSENSGGDFWPGGIDEVAFYPAALSDADILAHYQNGTNAAPAQPYDQLVQASTPVGYWRLNEPAGACNLAVNSGVRAGSSGIYSGDALPGAEAPRGPAFFGFEDTNTAVNLNGSNAFVASVSGLLNGLSQFSISGWIRREADQANRTGLWGQNDIVEMGYINNGTIQAWTDNGLDVVNPFPNGTWAHLALVSEGSPGVLKMYTNGVLAGQRNHVLPVTNAFRFQIGGGGVFDISRNFFLGQMDEVAVFDRALTASQIGAQYFSTVAQAPIIVSQPTGTTNIFEGQTLTLTVQATGSPQLQYQWTYFSTAIPGQTNATLVITNAATTDSGSYAVTVTNLFGTVESAVVEVVVNASQPPEITLQPVSLTRLAGTTASFTVAATGSGNLRYQWQLGTTPIPNATNTTLVITNVQPANAGDYLVIVTNAFGTATSATATLTVLPVTAGSYQAAVVAGNPMAYWQLGEASGTTAFDYVGGFDGTYNGNVTLGVPGAITGSTDTAAYFDGTNSANAYVGTPLQLNNMPNVTMLGWIRRETNQANRTGLFGQNDLVEFGYIDNNTIQAWVDNFDQAVNISPNPIPNEQWGQVGLVLNSGVATVFVNGSAAGTATLPSSNYGSNGFRFNIAGGGIFDTIGANGNWFNGRVDEVAVYNRALTAAEICGLYFLGSGAPLALDFEQGGAFVLDTKPSGTPHPGRNFGASWSNSVADAGTTTRDGAMTFVSTENDQIVVPAHADFNASSGTIMFWVRTAGTDTSSGDFAAMLFDRRTDVGGRTGDVITQTDAGNIFVQADGPGDGYANTFSSVRTINDGLWHHIAYVYDQSASGAITLYIDGVQDATQANSAAWNWPPAQPIELGRSHDGYWRIFNGSMDDVRVYNTMLTAEQIAQVFADDSAGLVAPSAMVLRLNFDAAPPGLTLRWPCGILQEATTLIGNGPGTQWTDVPNATPPYSLLPDQNMRFFRLRQ